MKHTKKRAVLSAVAMLIVSAIALSSATYAWFSSGNAVGVDQIQATVSNSDGSILISATGAAETWKTQLSLTDLQSNASNRLPATLVPVSVTMGTTPQIIGGSITDATFSATGLTTAGFIEYTVYIKATTATNVNITPLFASSVAFVYGGVVQGSNVLLLNANDGRSYRPIDNTTLTAVDTNTNDIIDPSEVVAGDLGDLQTATQATDDIALSMTAEQIYPIKVLVWAEGQDAACRGIVPPSSSSMTLTISKV